MGAACRKVSEDRISGTRSVRNAESSASSPRVVSVTAFDLPVVPPVQPYRHHGSKCGCVDDDFSAKIRLVFAMDHTAHARIRDLVTMIVHRLARVHGNAHQPRFGKRIISHEAIDPVGKEHADSIPRVQAFGEQRVPKPVRERVEFPIADGPLAFDKAWRILEMQSGPPDQPPDLHQSAPLPASVRERAWSSAYSSCASGVS
jgi:hypothetical protein